MMGLFVAKNKTRILHHDDETKRKDDRVATKATTRHTMMCGTLQHRLSKTFGTRRKRGRPLQHRSVGFRCGVDRRSHCHSTLPQPPPFHPTPKAPTTTPTLVIGSPRPCSQPSQSWPVLMGRSTGLSASVSLHPRFVTMIFPFGKILFRPQR